MSFVATRRPGRPDRTTRASARGPSLSSLVALLVVGAAALFVWSQLQPHLLLANTTPAGGDMGGHVWGPAYLRDHLLRHGRLSGWSPDWYAGFPYLTFYFPLPALLIVALNVVLPYGIAFKLVTVLGLVTLPVAAWAFGRLADLEQPGPTLLAVGMLPFLFDRTFTIYGGNIPSTLAGEFAFSISLSLCLLFLGVYARGLRTGRHRALGAALLALTALCHIVPAFFAGVGMVVLTVLVGGPVLRRLRHLLAVGGIGGLLAGFWVVPFLARLPYTNDMGWEKLVTYKATLLPASDRWVQVLAVVGILLSLVLRRRIGIFLSVMATASGVAFVFAPQGRLWNARLLPFWVLSLYLLAAVAVGELGRLLGAGIGAGTPLDPAEGRSRAERGAVLATPILALVAALFIVALPLPIGQRYLPVATADHSFIPDWAKWNYSGYERKPAYPEYRDLIATMTRVGQDDGCGRAMWEYEPELDRLGTPMALMLLPYWTKGCIGSMEGLFFESSATTPYHFLNQSELSTTPSRAQRDLPYRPLDVAGGVKHLQLLGVKYYMALSDEAKAQADFDPDLRPVASSGPWSVSYTNGGTKQRTWQVYEVASSDIVAPLDEEPVVMLGVAKGGKPWLQASSAWYSDPSRWDVPLATGGPRSWARVQGASAQPPRTPVVPATVTDIRSNDDSISFHVDRIGSPVLVKASYFPNWQVSGAKGVWRVTPNQMVVIPTSHTVRLHYGTTPVDGFAWFLTLAGVAGLWLVRRPVPLPDAAPDTDDRGGDHGGVDDADADADDDLDAELAEVLAGGGHGAEPVTVPGSHERPGPTDLG